MASIFRELLGSNVFRRKVWRHARMKNADWPQLQLKLDSSLGMRAANQKPLLELKVSTTRMTGPELRV